MSTPTNWNSFDFADEKKTEATNSSWLDFMGLKPTTQTIPTSENYFCQICHKSIIDLDFSVHVEFHTSCRDEFEIVKEPHSTIIKPHDGTYPLSNPFAYNNTEKAEPDISMDFALPRQLWPDHSLSPQAKANVLVTPQSSSNTVVIASNLSCQICGKQCKSEKQFQKAEEDVYVDERYRDRVRLSPYSCKDLTFCRNDVGWAVCGTGNDCLFCYQTCSDRNNLRRHISEKHKFGSISYNNLISKSKYYCEICNLYFDESRFLNHRDDHLKKKDDIDIVNLTRKSILRLNPNQTNQTIIPMETFGLASYRESPSKKSKAKPSKQAKKGKRVIATKESDTEESESSSEEDELDYSDYCEDDEKLDLSSDDEGVSSDSSSSSEDDYDSLPDIAKKVMPVKPLHRNFCSVCENHCPGKDVLRTLNVKVKITDSQKRLIRTEKMTCKKLTFYKKDGFWALVARGGKCTLCDFRAKDMQRITNHLSEAHKICPISFDLLIKNKKCKCMICSKYIPPDKKESHLKTHSKTMKSVKCKVIDGEDVIVDSKSNKPVASIGNNGKRKVTDFDKELLLFKNDLNEDTSASIPRKAPRLIICGSSDYESGLIEKTQKVVPANHTTTDLCQICNKVCTGSSEMSKSGISVEESDKQSKSVKKSPFTCQHLTFVQKPDGWAIGGMENSCLLCSWKGGQISYVRKHLASSHKLRSISFRNLISTDKYLCKICKMYFDKTSFAKHVQSHETRGDQHCVLKDGNRTIIDNQSSLKNGKTLPLPANPVSSPVVLASPPTVLNSAHCKVCGKVCDGSKLFEKVGCQVRPMNNQHKAQIMKSKYTCKDLNFIKRESDWIVGTLAGSCLFCDYSGAQVSHSRNHLLEHRFIPISFRNLCEPEKYFCKLCKLHYMKRTFDQHIAFHTDKDQQVIVREDDNFFYIDTEEDMARPNNSEELQRLKKSVKDWYDYDSQCKICSEYVASRTALKWHYTFFHQVPTKTLNEINDKLKAIDYDLFPCKFCKHTFYDVESHIENFHRLDKSSTWTEVAEYSSRLICVECNEVFNDREAFVTHFVAIHQVDKSLLEQQLPKEPKPVCELCGCEADDLKLHYESSHRMPHRSKAEFLDLFKSPNDFDARCILCKSVFPNHYGLLSHFIQEHRLQIGVLQAIEERAKSDEKKRKCYYCSKEDSFFHDLDSHIQEYHKLDKSLTPEFVIQSSRECHSCVKKFESYNSYVSHLMLEHQVNHMVVRTS